MRANQHLLVSFTWGIGLTLAGCAQSTGDAGGHGLAGYAGAGGSGAATPGIGGTPATGGATATGGTATGGASASGGNGAGAASSGGTAGAAPHTVGKCDSLGGVNVWEDITPPEVKAQLPGPGQCTYGTGAFVLDPSTSGTIYLGTCNMGVWKTTDCGANWVHIDTGANAQTLDTGRQWTFAIDPTDPKVLYTNSGYGARSNGAFKSTDGGVNWEQIWPSPSIPNQVDFTDALPIDPDDPQHLLMSFHGSCSPPHTAACLGETTDGGATWRLVDGKSSWFGGEGQFVWFLDDGNTWMFGSETNGSWRTSDRGATWNPVSVPQSHGSGQMIRLADGTFYLAGAGMLKSTDGITWTRTWDSPNYLAGLATDGTTMFTVVGFPWSADHELYLPFWTSPQTDGRNWTQMASPKMGDGGQLAYDTDHNLLYSSNEFAGFWRVVTK